MNFEKNFLVFVLEKSLTNQKKFSIEPISWNDILPSANTEHLVCGKKQGLPKPKRRHFTKLEALEHERSFINLITQDVRRQRSNIPRIFAVNKLTQSKIAALTSSHPLGTVRKREPRKTKRVLGKSSPSDSSSDEQPAVSKSSAAGKCY